LCFFLNRSVLICEIAVMSMYFNRIFFTDSESRICSSRFAKAAKRICETFCS
jgi:hypothetical protein